MPGENTFQVVEIFETRQIVVNFIAMKVLKRDDVSKITEVYLDPIVEFSLAHLLVR